MDINLVNSLLQALVLCVIGVIGYLLRELVKIGVAYLKAKVGTEQFIQLKAMAETIVRALEQSPAFQELGGADKKERAMAEIQTFCEDNNIPIDHDFLDKLVEEAVNYMNAEIGKIDLK